MRLCSHAAVQRNGVSLAAMDSRRFDTEVYARRLAAATAATAEASLAGLVITPGYDLRYLLGLRAQTFERLTALVLPGGLTPWVGHAESQDVPGGSEMIHPYGKEKLP